MRRGKLLIGALAAIGVPASAAALWHDLTVRHPAEALMIAFAWEATLVIGTALVKVGAKPANRRLDQIGEAVDRALGRRFSRYDRSYRQWALDSKRFMEAKGLATVGDFTPELDEVFVDVSLAPRAPHQVPLGMLIDVPPDVTQRHSIWEFLGHAEPLVLAVIGAPGSGKTTLLRHVARRVAQNRRQYRRTIPILLELRDHARQIAADPKVTLAQLLREALPPLQTAEPMGWWEDRLQRGKCVILLDGLDEVARTEDRQRVADWANQQITVYSRNDWVITSRPHGYPTAVIDGAKVLQVRPFTDEQVRRFLHGWYLAVERRATGTSGREVEMRAEESANDLLDRLAATPALHDLTINPLLLTMIANVHRYRGSLPGSRADLYGEVCQVMLWRRREAKKLASDLAGPSMERLLAKLAYTMMQQRIRDMPRQQVLEVVRPGLRRMSASATPENFLADVGSNGLLVEREKDVYAFAHLTFQEYLAGRHIRDNNLEKELVRTVSDPWWREATLLYVSGGDADAIARACLESGTIAALSLAFECTETDAELAPDLRARLNEIVALAFRDNADREHRQLVAGVLATRQLRQLVSTSVGSRVCPRPISADLYWLFVHDTYTPPPDGPCKPDLEAPAAVTGMWGRDAHSFANWVNTVTRNAESPFRLPTAEELQDVVTSGGPATAQAMASWTGGVWIQTQDDRARPELWTFPGRRAPNTLTGRQLLAAVMADVRASPALSQFASINLHARARILEDHLSRLESRSRRRVSAIDNEIRRRANYFGPDSSDPLIGPLERDRTDAANLVVAIVRARGRAERLARAFVATRDDNRISVLDLPRASDLSTMVNGVIEGARAIAYDLDRARDLDQDRSLVNARDRARDLAATLADAHERAVDIARILNDALGATEPNISLDLDKVLGLDRANEIAMALDRVDLSQLDLAIVLEQAFGAVFGRSLMRTTQLTLSHTGTNGQQSADAALAQALMGTAGVSDTDELAVYFDELSTLVDSASNTLVRHVPSGSRPATVAKRLAAAATPVFTRARRLEPARAAAIRLPAVVLAADARSYDQMDLAQKFVSIAVGVTLLQIRRDNPLNLETLILARE